MTTNGSGIRLLIPLAFSVLASTAYAQDVSTVVTGFNANGDVALSSTGDLYFSDEGTTIYRREPHGVVSVFANGFIASRGVQVDATGDTLFVADFAGFIRKVDPNGSVSIFSSGLAGASGLAWGPDGNLYCTTHTAIYRVFYPSGAKELIVSSGTFNRPHGIGVGPTGIIYVASAHDGNVFAVTETGGGANITLLAHVSGLQQQWACGFMTYAAGALYITNGDNKVHRITVAGVESTYAGTGVGGWLDGPAASAQFLAPNGIFATPDGVEVYVAEYGVQRIRVIRSGAVDVGDASSVSPPFHLGVARPNPFTPRTTIRYDMTAPGYARLTIFDASGRRVRTLVDGRVGAGSRSVSWNGRSDAGARVAPGVYFYRLQVDGTSRTRAVTLLR